MKSIKCCLAVECSLECIARNQIVSSGSLSKFLRWLLCSLNFIQNFLKIKHVAAVLISVDILNAHYWVNTIYCAKTRHCVNQRHSDSIWKLTFCVYLVTAKFFDLDLLNPNFLLTTALTVYRCFFKLIWDIKLTINFQSR